MDKNPKTAAILINFTQESIKKYNHIFSCFDCSLYFYSRKKAESMDSAKPGEYWYSIRSGYSAKCPHCGKCLRDLKNREIPQEAVVEMVIKNLGGIFSFGNSSEEY